MLIHGELRFMKILKSLKVVDEKGTEHPILLSALEEIEEQLIRGDKYEHIVRDLEAVYKCQQKIVIPDEYRGYQGGTLKYLLEKVKEKYFPKPKTASFMEGVEKGYELGLKIRKLNHLVELEKELAKVMKELM